MPFRHTGACRSNGPPGDRPLGPQRACPHPPRRSLRVIVWLSRFVQPLVQNLSCRVVQTRQPGVGPTRARAPTRVGPTRPVFVQNSSSDKTTTRQTSCRRRSATTPSHQVLCGRRVVCGRQPPGTSVPCGDSVSVSRSPIRISPGACLARSSAAGLVRLSRLAARADSLSPNDSPSA